MNTIEKNSLVNVALIIIDRTNVPMTGICFFFGICAFYIHTDTHSHIYGHIYTHPNTIYIRNFHYRIVYPIERVSEEDKEDNDDLYSMWWQFILATHTKHIIIIIKPNKQLFDERIFCTFFLRASKFEYNLPTIFDVHKHLLSREREMHWQSQHNFNVMAHDISIFMPFSLHFVVLAFCHLAQTHTFKHIFLSDHLPSARPHWIHI